MVLGTAVRRTLSTLALSAGFIAGAHAQSGADGAAIPHGGTLVIGSTSAPRSLNGAVQSGMATAIPSTQLFASPLRFDANWKPHPYLAESWELSSDDKTLTLHLRKNAFFHDGTPITSEDVAFSLMAIKADHPFSTMLAPVERVDTPDRYTAVVRMKTPYPAILLAMSPALAPIMPKHVYGQGDLKTNPHNLQGVVGSGPFKLVEFTPGQRIVLQRFDKFFLPNRPYLDRIVISYVPDMSSLSLSLQRGDVQMLPFMSSTTDLRRLQGDPKIVVTDKGYEGIGGINWLAFNLRSAPVSNLAVRQAIACAIDKNFIVRALQGGFSKVANGPIISASPYASKDPVVYPLDLDKSRALLDAAGFHPGPDGMRMTLTLDYSPGDVDQQKNVAEYIRAQLKKVGINVVVRTSADFASWAKRIGDGDFQMTMDTVFNWGDPVIGVARTYMSTNIKPMVWTNTQAYDNPKVDQLLNEAAVETDDTKRKQLYDQFTKIVTHDLPLLYINEAPYHTVTTKNVGNVPESIWGPASPFDKVYLK